MSKLFNETPSGYRFNKIIFLSAILILIGIVAYNLSVNGYEQHPYFKCNSPTCINPIATEKPVCTGGYCPPIKCLDAWCFQSHLPMGEYGIKPPAIQKYFGAIGISIIILAFFLNHFLFNKNAKFSLPTKRKLVPFWLEYPIKLFFPNFTNEIDFKKFEKENKNIEILEDEK